MLDGGFPGNHCIFQSQAFHDTRIQSKFALLGQLQDRNRGKQLGNGRNPEASLDVIRHAARPIGVAVCSLE